MLFTGESFGLSKLLLYNSFLVICFASTTLNLLFCGRQGRNKLYWVQSTDPYCTPKVLKYALTSFIILFSFAARYYTPVKSVKSIDRQDQCISKTGNMIILSHICKDTLF